MQRLAATEHGGQGLDGDANDIVFRLLRGEGGAGSLRMEAQEQRTGIPGVEPVAHNSGPQAARGAVLGDFFEQIVVRVEEEGELRREFVDAEAGVKRGLHVGDAVGEGEGDFLNGGRARFADVVAGDGDGVPAGEFVAAPGKNIGDDAHGRAHGINVRAAGDVFLQNVVLHGAGKFLQIGALLFGHGDVEAEKNRGGGVDGHGGGNFFERDAFEERFHIFERIDGYADFADFAARACVIRVHPDLRRQIERDGESGRATLE